MCVKVCILVVVTQQANHSSTVLYYSVTCSPFGFSIFSHYLINGTIFGKTLLNIKRMF